MFLLLWYVESSKRSDCGLRLYVSDFKTAVPKLFGNRDQFCGRQFLYSPGWWWGGVRDGFGIIQVHYIYCAFYFYCYYISSISDHQALDPIGWGPLR